MEIKIGIEENPHDGPTPYYWIESQGFTLQNCEDIEEAEYALNMMQIAFEKIPGVTVKRIEGYSWYGGI